MLNDKRSGSDQGRRASDRNSFLYRATYNGGKLEATFFAQDDEHASRVAHEYGERTARAFGGEVLFDAVQRVGAHTPGAEAVGEIYNQADGSRA